MRPFQEFSGSEAAGGVLLLAAAALARYTERVHELDPELQPEERDDKAPHDAAAPNPPDVRRRQAMQLLTARRERPAAAQ